MFAYSLSSLFESKGHTKKRMLKAFFRCCPKHRPKNGRLSRNPSQKSYKRLLKALKNKFAMFFLRNASDSCGSSENVQFGYLPTVLFTV